jgi:hypothetical protein
MTRCADGITLAAISATGGASATHGELSSKSKNTAPVKRIARSTSDSTSACALTAGAAGAIRALTDAELDRAATVSLYDDAVLTCQFVLEDHAVRHSYHHLATIRAAVRR